jgi:predicted DNA-binding transcriptional regulator AlpA
MSEPVTELLCAVDIDAPVKTRRPPRPRVPVIPPTHGDQVIPTKDAAALSSLSVGYFRKLHKEGKGPAFVRLGAARVSYRWRDRQEWIESRKNLPREDKQ